MVEEILVRAFILTIAVFASVVGFVIFAAIVFGPFLLLGQFVQNEKVRKHYLWLSLVCVFWMIFIVAVAVQTLMYVGGGPS